MAKDTSKRLRNQVIYCVFVRNYSEEGTFAGVERDLDRIRDLGVDIIWLMPIHPIGVAERKGRDGSPYANKDYRTVNPEYGTMQDLKSLVDAIHDRGMKCIIDVVYNHTSPDSILAAEHPEWFHRDADGRPVARVAEWTDIVDLDYTDKALWDYQTETLKMWAETVDGFRCDVAPMVPVEFWMRAREEAEKIRPGCIWLAESVEPGYIKEMRGQGCTVHSDGELYNAFDITYDYDIYEEFQAYFEGRGTLSAYLEALNRQEYIYPDNYVKLHFLENHDRLRAHAIIPDVQSLRNWTAFIYFMKGTTLIYNGQETGETHYISLFDRDTIRWDREDNDTPGLSELMRRLHDIKRKEIFADGSFHASEVRKGIILARRKAEDESVTGVFGVEGTRGAVPVGLPDGIYDNLIDGIRYEVKSGCILFTGEPVILM